MRRWEHGLGVQGVVRNLFGLLDGLVVTLIRLRFGGPKMDMFNVKKGGFKPSWVIIHHSLTDDGYPKNWDTIKIYHTVVKGWKDIGYNLGIENVAGKITLFEGRKIGEVGAHAIGFNSKSVGICLVGNYDMDTPSEDRLKCLASVCRDLQREYKIPRDQVIGHWETFVKRDVPIEKSCPGKLFDIDKFRKRLIDA